MYVIRKEEFVCQDCHLVKPKKGRQRGRCSLCAKELWESNLSSKGIDPRERKRELRDRRWGVDIEALEKKQNYLCAICHLPETRTYRGEVKSLAVDHCHSTGEVRGLLCSDCNVGLGFFKDDPERLKSALSYLSSLRETPHLIPLN